MRSFLLFVFGTMGFVLHVVALVVQYGAGRAGV